MDLHNTEDQQVEMLKSYWQQYGTTLIASVVLSIALIIGWQYYQQEHTLQQENIADAYEKVIAVQDDPEQFFKALMQFETEHDHKGYQSLLYLMSANIYTKQNNLVQAEQMLKRVIDRNLLGITEIASLRLARVQIQQKQYDTAQKTLNSITSAAFKPNKQELLGDLYLMQGLNAEAREAYKLAEQALPQSEDILTMKINDLSS
ncbi:MAG: tetratricopeptide repeat protein [Shewanellaceae bacterium]|nr:tetratricopeptide repeat protein [Shewanellaceae bacterium]